MSTAAMSAAVSNAAGKHYGKRERRIYHDVQRVRQEFAWVLWQSSAEEIQRALASSDSRPPHSEPLRAPVDRPSPYPVVEGIKSICIREKNLVRHALEAAKRGQFTTYIHTSFGLRRRWRSQKLTDGLDDAAAALAEEELTGEVEGQWWETLYSEQREPQTPAQFDRMVRETCYLADELLTEAYRLEYPNDPAGQRRAMEILDSPWRMIFMLRNEGYPKYRHPKLDPGFTPGARIDTNAAIRRVFGEWEYTLELMNTPTPPPAPSVTALLSGRRQIRVPTTERYHRQFKVWVAKICYSLLVAEVPPGIHNYNALILGFTRVGEHSLAQIVVNSFLFNTHFRPSRQTIVCLLHHYSAQNDMIGFYRILRRLVGFDPRGIKIRRRSLEDVADQSRSTQLWLRRTDIAVSQEFFVQRTSVNPPVVQAIMTGLQSFDQVRHAAIVFSSFLGSCRKLSIEAFLELLNGVLDSVDAYAARELLKGLVENVHLVTPLLLDESPYARKLVYKIRLLQAVATAPPYRTPQEQEQERLQEQQRELRWQQRHQLVSKQDNGISTRAQIFEALAFAKQKEGAQRLSCAVFLADTQMYLYRLGRIVKKAKKALAMDTDLFVDSAHIWAAKLDQLLRKVISDARQQQQYRCMANVKAQTEATTDLLEASKPLSHVCLRFMSRLVELPDAYRLLVRMEDPPLGIQSALLNVIKKAPRRGLRAPETVQSASQGENVLPASLEAEMQLLERFVSVDMLAQTESFEARLKNVLCKGQKPDKDSVARIESYWASIKERNSSSRPAPPSNVQDMSRVDVSFDTTTRRGRQPVSALDPAVALQGHLVTGR